MNLKPIVGAAVGAFVGAAIWAGISIVTGYEVGYVAWGVGALVGFCSAFMGGEGIANGVACAILALGAIFAGKMWAMEKFINDDLEASIEESLGIDQYEVLKAEAAEFASLETEDEYPAFMLMNGYSEALTVDEISAEEVDDFKFNFEDSLLAFATNPPTYDAWRDEQEAMARAWVESTGTAGFVLDSLSPIDLVFALLGIATAFQIGTAGLHPGTEEEEEVLTASEPEAQA